VGKAENYKKFKKIFPRVREGVFLAPFTTMRVGGRADLFLEAETEKDLIEAIAAAKKFGIPYFILGGGSNIIIADKGFGGVVIKNQNSKIEIQNYNSKSKIIQAAAGVLMSRLVRLAAENNLSGLEWAMGLPGTLGGAIYGNAGWPKEGRAISDVIEKVMVLEIPNKSKIFNSESQIKIFKNSDCRFDYRDSIFKHKKNLIILGAILRLQKGQKTEIKKRMNQVLNSRLEKQPKGFSSGCIFKNQKLKIKNRKLLRNFPELKNFSKNGFVPAGWLIDQVGLKGKKIGGAKISEMHANFIINKKTAKALDIKKLIDLTKSEVAKKFGLKLEEEIEYLGG